LPDDTVKPLAYAFTSANVEKLEIKSKVSAETTEAAGGYTKDDVNTLAVVLLGILNNTDVFHERIVFICRLVIKKTQRFSALEKKIFNFFYKKNYLKAMRSSPCCSRWR
jgi:hypothetical protein